VFFSAIVSAESFLLINLPSRAIETIFLNFISVLDGNAKENILSHKNDSIVILLKLYIIDKFMVLLVMHALGQNAKLEEQTSVAILPVGTLHDS